MFISSDSNIWIDFEFIGHLDHPFLLDYKYYLSDVTYHDELMNSKSIKRIVDNNKLHITSLTSNEIKLANRLIDNYINISLQDALALAIAINRDWILLTGDKALISAAKKEKVKCHGTIWIYDELVRLKKISKRDYHQALKDLLVSSKKGRRLPIDEINKRLNGN